jgi:uncharacterized membrane protein
MKKIFFNDRIIYGLILMNVVIIYLHSFDFFRPYYFELDLLDSLFTIFFCVEIGFKIAQFKNQKIKSYFQDHWNKIDFVSILFSLPSLGALFVHDLEMFAGFTVLRSLRIFKLLRVIDTFQTENESVSNCSKHSKALDSLCSHFLCTPPLYPSFH